MHPTVMKLRRFIDISDAEAEALTFSANGNSQQVAAGQDLIGYGQPVVRAALLEEGWAMRHRTLSDGRRQILGFVLPGDFCDPTVFVEHRAHAAVTAITPARATFISAQEVHDLAHRSPTLSNALWWQSAHEHAATRAHMFALGRFNAYERLAYLLQQLAERLGLVGAIQGGSFRFPGTQQHLADALGMTHVHVSRTLAKLADDGVVVRRAPNDLQVNVAQLRAVLELGSACRYLRTRNSTIYPRDGGWLRSAS